MRKLFLAGICLMVFEGRGFGQRDSSKSKPSPSFSINAGIGLPPTFSLNILHFGAENNSYGYYALSGPSINMYLTIPLKNSHFGIAGMVVYGSNKFNLNYFNGDFPTYSSGNYNVITLLPGIIYRIPFKVNSIDFHLLGGALYFRTPIISHSGYFNNQALAPGYNVDMNGTWVANSINNISLCFDIGTSVKLMFSERFFVEFNADILYSGLDGGLTINSQFTGTYNGTQVNGADYTYNGGFYYNEMSLFNLSIGVGYKF